MSFNATIFPKSEVIAYLFQLIVNYNLPTAKHSCRVQKIAVGFAVKLGLSFQIIQQIAMAALLHDIGKIIIPKEILNKPDKLTNHEFEIIKQHPENGYHLLQKIDPLHQLENVADAILSHHERYDGTGYPCGKVGDEIPLVARILSITDVYEAITSNRVYHTAMTQKEANKIIDEGKESHFDPYLVDVFLRIRN
ncbi:HD-GYP domain-containing protein [Pelosinus propionicus]|uniref:HD domain-containing protein n=1 Tax=Pelosinus propionicus DSM 13327 TaxID=1123291 RepID=A0A1I4GMC1_9FIRM|nr:HD-GYP domain-containing protein [Pelosinus propionicus]SFL31039.1 HD domain-containing protein [Pelosinus propionicus DSM 13327]